MIDPITLSVLWNGLLSIAEEMGGTLRRTAFSAAVREGEDFSPGLFDRRGRLVAQGNFTPGHLGAMPYVVKSVMEYFPTDKLRPGDGVILNDSFLGSGHFPDIFLVSPVFVGSELVAYVANVAHHVDMGGAAPGSEQVLGVTEAFQEGLRILPIRLVREGAFDEDLLRVILGNVRLPDQVRGDLVAQRNANFLGAQRLVKLFADYGIDTVEAGIESIFARSEARMRELIRQVPDGVYSFEDYLEDCGPADVKVAVDVTVAGDEITIDFSRSSDQVPVSINSYINYTRAYTMFAVKVFADALLPQNDGVRRPVHTVAREGSFFNPVFPAPSSGRAAVQVRIFEAVNGAMAKALPQRALAAFSHWGNPKIGGIDDRTGRCFIMYDLIFGGYGARAFKDGAEALCPVFNCANVPVEVQETQNPIFVRRLELIPDSGGAGKYRGGCGIRKDIELRTGAATITLLGDRHKHAPYGLFGGRPGKLAQTILNPDGEAVPLTSKEVRQLRRGDVVSFRLSGGGGYGNVAERDPAAVEADVADGYVSAQAAVEVYGQSAAKRTTICTEELKKKNQRGKYNVPEHNITATHDPAGSPSR
jgi:N-methylhydantoinase B